MGKKFVRGAAKCRSTTTAETLVRDFEAEAERQRLFVKKARRCENLLRIAVAALKEVAGDENFVTLQRAEGMATLPRLAGTEAPWSRDLATRQETV